MNDKYDSIALPKVHRHLIIDYITIPFRSINILRDSLTAKPVSQIFVLIHMRIVMLIMLTLSVILHVCWLGVFRMTVMALHRVILSTVTYVIVTVVMFFLLI